ncbi:MAG TPA: hypothetical protein VF111_14595 [Thermoanaerobaculia bacterium]
MNPRTLTGSALTLLLIGSLLTGCTGGTESNAAVEQAPSAEAPEGQVNVDARQALHSIGEAIPVYADAQYRDDLTRRDSASIRNQYGEDAEVYTLATDDSFPQVYHYYTTYLAQFRAFPAQDTLPPDGKQWRTLEVQLNQAMQDPFIPGQALNVRGKQVTLQIAETEAEPETVIRYIVTPAGAPAPQPQVATTAAAGAVAR